MRARAVTSILLAGVSAAILAGCGFVTPIATQFTYDPSDGVSGDLGEVSVLNALVLTEDGTNGNLLFTAVNDSEDALALRVQYEVDGDDVDLVLDLEPSSVTSFGFGETGQLLLPDIEVVPGSLLSIYFQYGAEPGVQLDVPVLEGQREEYAPYLPMPVPTPTETATPEPIETTAP